MRPKIANRSGSGPRSVTSTCTRPVSSVMLRARTTSTLSPICSEPTTTRAAPTSWPIRPASWRLRRLPVLQRDLQHAARLAGAAAGDDLGVRAHVEEHHQSCDCSGVEAAEGYQHRFTDRTKNRGTHVDAGRAAPQLG